MFREVLSPMKNMILFLCESCRAELAEAFKLVRLPSAETSGKTRKCDKCCKNRIGELYHVRWKGGPA